MRKKLKMRAGGTVKKYAEGGEVASPRRSPISNNPVGTNMARGRTPVGATALEDTGDRGKALEMEVTAPRPAPRNVGDLGAFNEPEARALPVPPVPPRRRAIAPRRQRGLSEADMLNERSLAAAREGRNMYKKGGKVK